MYHKKKVIAYASKTTDLSLLYRGDTAANHHFAGDAEVQKVLLQIAAHSVLQGLAVDDQRYVVLLSEVLAEVGGMSGQALPSALQEACLHYSKKYKLII